VPYLSDSEVGFPTRGAVSIAWSFISAFHVCVQLSAEAVKRVNEGRRLMQELLQQNKGESMTRRDPASFNDIDN